MTDTTDAAAVLVGRTFAFVDVAGTPVLDGAAPEITFGADGRVSGRATVNRIMGSYDTDRDTLVLSELATTMMAGLPDAMDQERRVLDALSRPLQVVALEGGDVALDDGEDRTVLAPVTEELL